VRQGLPALGTQVAVENHDAVLGQSRGWLRGADCTAGGAVEGRGDSGRGAGEDGGSGSGWTDVGSWVVLRQFPVLGLGAVGAVGPRSDRPRHGPAHPGGGVVMMALVSTLVVVATVPVLLAVLDLAVVAVRKEGEARGGPGHRVALGCERDAHKRDGGGGGGRSVGTNRVLLLLLLA
jgi:hypothetical protein